MATHNEFGKLGEQKAIDYLKEQGYTILAQNYRYLNAEIDILAKKGEILAIVEVKSRNMGFLEDISTVISPKKIRLLTMAANQFVVEKNLDVEVRFDLIKVIKSPKKTEIEHIENAFYHF
jgi:putative endonuclease